MKELTKHIEALLLENDCVILPHFGGFITSHAPAQWIEEENTFLPPYRTIGFNPQLKINDGLLVQSYMQVHDATFPEATRLVERAIDKLSEDLYKEGIVELYNIGTLHRSITGDTTFTPTENGVITPALYGLGSLELKTLAQLASTRRIEESEVQETENKKSPVIENKGRTITIKLRHDWIVNVAATAAAIVLFFLISPPVGNTDIVEENYASLGHINVFDQVKSESVITNVLEMPAFSNAEVPVAKTGNTSKKSVSDAKPAPVATVKAAPAKAKSEMAPAEVAEKPATKQTPTATAPVAKATEASKTTPHASAQPATEAPKAEQKKPAVTYNVIVASVASEKDARQAISEFATQGHSDAFLIRGGGRFRIALAAFDNEADAYRKANELRQEALFKDAWVLKDRK